MELLANLLAEPIATLDLGPFVQVEPDQSIRAAIENLRSAGRGCTLVAKAGRLTGIFTERDVLTRVLTQNVDLEAPITTVMSKNPVTVSAKDTVADTLRQMRGGDYRHVPLIDNKGRILGVVSIKDIVCYLVEHFPQSIYNLPPDPSQVQTQREGA